MKNEKKIKEFDNTEDADNFILKLDDRGIVAYSTYPESGKVLVHYETETESEGYFVTSDLVKAGYINAPERCKYSGETDCNDCLGGSTYKAPCGAEDGVDEPEPIPESGLGLVSDRVANRLNKIKIELIEMYDNEGLYLSTQSLNAIQGIVTALYKAESMLKNRR